MRHIGISQWRNVSEVNLKRGGGHGEPRGLPDFLWAYWLCFQNNELRFAAYVSVIVLLSFQLYVPCKSRIDSNKVSKYSQKISVYLVDRFHYYITIIPYCRHVSINISLLLMYYPSEVKERENPPFLSTSGRRGMCTPSYIDSNTEEGNIPKYIHGV